MSKQEQEQRLANEEVVLAQIRYKQSDADTPELDMQEGRFTEIQEESKGDGVQRRESFHLTVLSSSDQKAHNSVHALVVDQRRDRQYSTGKQAKDRSINCYDLAEKRTLTYVKTSNAKPLGLEIDSDFGRLYVSTREGMVLIFDVKNVGNTPSARPVMIHTIRFAQVPKNGPADYIKQMDLDQDQNTLLCRSKAGVINIVLLQNKSILKTIKVATIDSYKGDKLEGLASFKWLSRMSCYCEGTSKGFLKIRDIQPGNEVILMPETGFTDKVRLIHYNKLKNVLFASSKDGQFRVWKIPHEWRSKVIEEREINAKYDQQVRLEKKARTSGGGKRAP